MNLSDRTYLYKISLSFPLLVIVVLSIGCSLFRPAGESSLMLLLSTDRETYRPAEAVVCTVQMVNTTDGEITIQNLNAKSLSFWLVNTATAETRKAEPVYSENEDMVFPRTLEAHEPISRRFVFTSATTTSGTYTLHAMYEGVLLSKKGSLFVPPSPKVSLTMTGERLVNRDLEGVIVKDDAIKIAEKALGTPAEVYDVRLVKNEAGFLDWWITFSIKPTSGKEGKEVKRAFLVNPYLGAVRKEVNPLAKQEKGDEPKVIPPYKRLHPVESTTVPLPEKKQPPQPEAAPKPSEPQGTKPQPKRR